MNSKVGTTALRILEMLRQSVALTGMCAEPERQRKNVTVKTKEKSLAWNKNMIIMIKLLTL